MKYLHRIVLLIWLSVANVPCVLAQPATPAGRDQLFAETAHRFFCEAHLLPQQDNNNATLLCLLRFSHDMLTFYKATLSVSDRAYYAPYTITIECRDTAGIIRHSKFISDTVFAADFQQTLSKKIFVSAQYAMSLTRTKYMVSIEIGQNTNTLRRYKSEVLSLHPSKKNATLTKPLIAYNANAAELRPVINNGNVPFTEQSLRFITIASSLQESDQYQYKYSRKASRDESDEAIAGGTEFSGRATLAVGSSLQSPEHGLYLLRAQLALQSMSSDSYLGMVETAVPVGEMSPGRYEYRLWKSGSADTLKYEFEVVWNDMPLSLRNAKYAAESMYYILNDKEYEDLMDASEKDMRRRLYEWWKKKDPTPRTLYNEAMTEYFSRVDYARVNYQTFGDNDGSRTDRGKIYILYGTPTTIRRSTNPNEVGNEVWVYENKVRKQFVFESGAKGNFRLVSVTDQ